MNQKKQMDKKEALKIVQEDGEELKNLPDEFKKDKEIVLEAVRNRGWGMKFIGNPQLYMRKLGQ